MPPAHFGYMVTGIDDEVTLRANRDGFLKFQLRPRRLVDVSTIDMTVEIFDAKYDNPIVIAPTGSNRTFHPDGEVAVFKAAKAGNHLQILSSGATASIEDAIGARGAPVWFQVYPRKWEVTEALARRAERAGSPVLVVTVDGGATNWETFIRLRCTDTRQCDSCHRSDPQAFAARRPNYDGIDVNDLTSLNIANLTWGSIMRLRDTVKMKIVLKGILTHEDAKLAADNGIDGIIVSNHGGRVVEIAAARQSRSCQRSSRPSTVECLCSSTAASGAAPISSKLWPSAHGACVSGVLICGASRRLVSRVSSGCLKSFVPRPAPPCSRSAHQQ